MTRPEALRRIEKLEENLDSVKGTECEIYSRVVGYFRPVKQWNNGKQEEFGDRKEFMVKKVSETAQTA